MKMNELRLIIVHGKERAITIDELCEITSWSRSAIKEKIQKLRDKGEVILSSQEGYYRPRQNEEGAEQVQEFISMMEEQAKSRMYRIRSARRWLNEYKQIKIGE